MAAGHDGLNDNDAPITDRFLLPFADHVERLPGPQREALRSTFGLVAGPSADRFLVALAALTWWADTTLGADLGAATVSTGHIYAAMDWLEDRRYRC